MTELDYAWAAGFLDGDGSFSLRVYRKPYRHMIQPIVQSSQRCPEPMERLIKIANGGTFNDTTKTPLGKQVWRVQITGKERLLVFLKGIQPYLIVKQKQCDLLLDCLSRQKDKGGSGYDENEWSWFFEQKGKIEAWNKES